MIAQPRELAYRRTGIEGPYGEVLTLPWRMARVHTHFCAEHDDRWDCSDAPCLRFDATPCEALR